MEHLKYPFGRFEYGKTYSNSETAKHAASIASLPSELNLLVKQFTPEMLEKSYRTDGWTARQIIHHIADSHANAFIRVKLTLTESTPVIKPYDQDKWALLDDSMHAPIESSLKMIEAIHERWSYILRSLTADDLSKKYIHPEYDREFRLDELIALYAWHGKQHCGHLQIILNQK
jgi:hypothetical protein